MKKIVLACLTLLALNGLLTGCDHRTLVPTPALTLTTLTTGLADPIGLETDPTGRVFVSESGTGKNDSRILLVAPDGKTYPVVTAMPSVVSPGGEVSGTDHLLYADGILYALNYVTGLYKINVASFKVGDAPIQASSLVPEDIRSFVLAYPFVNNANDSHAYNMVLGPDGSIYMTDAGANAILRRAKNGTLSVVAEVPGIKNPTPVGPPTIQSVPTGITYDGTKFIITTLLGFPFPAGQAIIYNMDTAGKLTVQKQAYNSLVDVETDGNNGALVLEHGVFGPTGFTANTGRLLRVNSAGDAVLFDKLNLPTDLKLYGKNTAYLVSYGDDSILKITY